MALSTSQVLVTGVSLILAASPAWAHQASSSQLTCGVRNRPTGLSAECLVPDAQLFTLAPLEKVKAALDEKRPVKVLALGSPAMSALGTGSASYPAWLEHELERLLPGSDFVMEHRATSGEMMEDGSHRIKGIVAEVEPDLVIWKVGTTEMLARVDTEEFARSLDETVKWMKEHDIDVVLVDPQYTASLVGDPGYKRLVASVETVARANALPLVFRSKAVRYLTEQRSNAGQNPFQLNELGYRCIAEHVVRAVLLGPRGHEVPPDMARPIHGIAAQKYEAGRLDRAHRDPVAGPEHQKLARPKGPPRSRPRQRPCRGRAPRKLDRTERSPLPQAARRRSHSAAGAGTAEGRLPVMI